MLISTMTNNSYLRSYITWTPRYVFRMYMKISGKHNTWWRHDTWEQMMTLWHRNTWWRQGKETHDDVMTWKHMMTSRQGNTLWRHDMETHDDVKARKHMMTSWHGNTWWRNDMETFSALVALLRGIHRLPVDFSQMASDAELWCFLRC